MENGLNRIENILPGGEISLPGLNTEFDFSGLMEKAGEVFVVRKAVPGQDIVLTNPVGLGGTVLLAGLYKEKLCSSLTESFVEEAGELLKYLKLAPEAAVAGRHGETAMLAVSRGGLFAALWIFGEALNTGLEVQLKEIPIKQQTIEFCEVFELNPYQLLCGGCSLLAVDNGSDAVRLLKEEGCAAAVIGKITKGRDRVIIGKEGRRYLTRPQPDELCKIVRIPGWPEISGR